MRAFLVEDPTEGVEAPLLSLEVQFGRTSSVGFQRSMHPLVAPILVRSGGFDEFRPDPELDPVHRELREASNGGGCEGYPVVALDHIWKPVETEEPIEAPPSVRLVDAKHSLAVQQEATEAVLDGKGIAELPVAGPKFALEVHGPDSVWTVHGGVGRTRMGPSPSRLAMLDQPGSVKDCMDSIHTGHVVEFVGNDLPELSSAPAAVAAELKHPG